MKKAFINPPDFAHYMVFEDGEVYNTLTGKTLKPCIHSGGYLKVTLSKGKERLSINVHKLVAILFIPNPQNKPTINHNDGDKFNNHKDNLSWATYSEQMKHSYKTLGRIPPWQGKKGEDHARFGYRKDKIVIT